MWCYHSGLSHWCHWISDLYLRGLKPTLQKAVKSVALPEQLLDVVPGLGWGLDEHDVQLFGFPLALFRRNLSLVAQVRLVADQHDDDVAAALRPDVVDPLRRLEQKWRTNFKSRPCHPTALRQFVPWQLVHWQLASFFKISHHVKMHLLEGLDLALSKCAKKWGKMEK